MPSWDLQCTLTAVFFFVGGIFEQITDYNTKAEYTRDNGATLERLQELDTNAIIQTFIYRLDVVRYETMGLVCNCIAWVFLAMVMVRLAWKLSEGGRVLVGTCVTLAVLAVAAAFTETIALLLYMGMMKAVSYAVWEYNLNFWLSKDVYTAQAGSTAQGSTASTTTEVTEDDIMNEGFNEEVDEVASASNNVTTETGNDDSLDMPDDDAFAPNTEVEPTVNEIVEVPEDDAFDPTPTGGSTVTVPDDQMDFADAPEVTTAQPTTTIEPVTTTTTEPVTSTEPTTTTTTTAHGHHHTTTTTTVVETDDSPLDGEDDVDLMADDNELFDDDVPDRRLEEITPVPSDGLGWKTMEILRKTLRGLLSWITSMEFLFLAVIFVMTFIGVRRSNKLSKTWAYAGLALSILSFIEFISDMTGYHNHPALLQLAIIVGGANRMILLPLWLMWLGTLIQKEAPADEETKQPNLAAGSSGSLA